MTHSAPPGPNYTPDFISDIIEVYDSLAVVLTAMDLNSGINAASGANSLAIAGWVAASNALLLQYRVAALEEVLTIGSTPPVFDKDKLFLIDSTPLTQA